ncbi:hypothetical protein L2Y94_08580 [Luteibacter aegosomatis]|uniref:hypothetical protein n=1 Tax=Luteibacter aegosomatis TaxID=2911537 RepID=UPI001FF97820|nr:hypothetical protein [Luteibacter aegosomatis]UPG87392.1 hypothetical protein L2Y94_08580 [Luteibacter aegosomatis]
MTRPDPGDAPVTNSSLPDGYVPVHVAPFVMRYGTDFLRAMRRAAVEGARDEAEAEPA